MKVRCNREKLREALAVANGVVPTKSPKPVLENVLIQALGDELELVGTDMEVALRHRIDAKDVTIEREGRVLVPARVATDFIRDLDGEEVQLELKNDTCTISSGSDSCELVTIDPDEYPEVSSLEGKGQVSVQAGVFTRLVARTSFAAARDAGRYAMHGVLIEVLEDRLQMVATDGRRMALASSPIDAQNKTQPGAIVPTKGVQLFCRVISDPLEMVSLYFTETQVGIKTKNSEVFTRLIDGEFPRYSAVIPQETTKLMEADAEVLARKLKLVANVAGDEARAVKLQMTGDSLQITGHSVGRGEAEAHMPCDFKGGEGDIAFNPDYVLDGLKNCEGSLVRLEFSDKTSPGKFCLGENYIYVVMPITVDTQ